MKPEEIIQYLEMVRPTENYSYTFSVSVGNTRHFGPGSQLNKDVSTAIDLAIKSLEKQIPVNPNGYDNGGAEYYEEWAECPKCSESIPEYTLENETECYCIGCGQKIDWSDK